MVNTVAGSRHRTHHGVPTVLSNQHSLNPWLFFILTLLSNSRENARAARRVNHHAHRQDSVAPRAVNHRKDYDTLNRDNTNKRGPKVEGDEGFIPAPHGYSALKSGVTCKRSSNIITLDDGSQCIEGSATHVRYLSTH